MAIHRLIPRACYRDACEDTGKKEGCGGTNNERDPSIYSVFICLLWGEDAAV